MYQRILVPVDGGATSEAGLAEAIKLGKLTGGTLRLVHVVDLVPYATGLDGGIAFTGDLMQAIREGGEAILQAAREQARASGLKLESHLVETFSGRASDQILDEATSCGADLIVIGTHGRRGVGRFLLGSDAEQVLRRSSVPVLLVRAEHGTPASEAK